MKDIARYVVDGTDLLAIVNARQVGVWAILCRIYRAREAEEIAALRRNPKRSPDNLKEDMVWRLGFAAGVDWCAMVPDEAKAYLEEKKEILT